MMYLNVKAITKHFGATCVAQGVGFSLARGEIGALLGPSGCGKTTLLRMIAGFEEPDSGSIHLQSRPLWEAGQGLAAEARQIGMVFQDYALFPHLTVWENIAFGMKDVSRREIKSTIDELLSVTGLAGVEKRYPHELSGGQQQRVALSRAIAPKPRCLLMDEPFSNLDVTLRESLSAEVREIIKRFGITALMVTHNQHEAFAMADRIGVMMAGNILQWDTPEGLYHKPETLSVARFIGEGSLLAGTLTSEGTLDCGLGAFSVAENIGREAVQKVHVFVRPEAVQIATSGKQAVARLEKSCFRGPGRSCLFQLPSGEWVRAAAETRCCLREGDAYGLSVSRDGVSLFSEHEEERFAGFSE
ncbi:ABC transporter ATP-binding protein [Desulfoluna sp.]|uniref:ABC transporter ATP-binding protein n=1 Tax=Desulfoluna sp. TaxID=2045199 RepID=UPI0026089DF0|nr:ABC transporter ATP-binding protein [Desulfoluna sp.]